MNDGECLACVKLSACRETNVERVLSSYTCILFEPAPEPMYQARWDAMKKFGEAAAVRAMLPLIESTTEEEEA